MSANKTSRYPVLLENKYLSKERNIMKKRFMTTTITKRGQPENPLNYLKYFIFLEFSFHEKSDNLSPNPQNIQKMPFLPKTESKIFQFLAKIKFRKVQTSFNRKQKAKSFNKNLER